MPIANVTAALTAAFHLNKGAVFIESGDFEWAVDAFTSELNLIPNYVCRHQIQGFSYYQTGQYRLTIADFNQAIQLGPGYAFAFSRRGLACDQL